MIAYGVIAILVMFLTWPYLWENPLSNFFNVFVLMSDNPTNLAVLFNGTLHRAGELPLRYLPFMLAATLTEPVWIFFGIGLLAVWHKLSARHVAKKPLLSTSITLLLGWFLIIIVYVFVRRPAMYDGFRHFLFILPPIFVLIGFGFEFLFNETTKLPTINSIHKHFIAQGNATHWLHAALVFLVILPGVRGIVKLHPYEYTYYNTFVGGTDGAFRNYETDYWLTCYKEAIEQLNQQVSSPVNLYVKREAYIAAEYADNHIPVEELDGTRQPQPGDYVLVNSRTNEDRTTAKGAPIVIEIQRGNATFCIVRQIP
jgi:hypothetical protein